MDKAAAMQQLMESTIEMLQQPLEEALTVIDAVGHDRDALFFIAGARAVINFMSSEPDDPKHRKTHKEFSQIAAVLEDDDGAKE